MKTVQEMEKKSRGYGWKRRITNIIACVVVFATTYALVLPAITLDDRRAANEPGLSLNTAAENEEGLSFDLHTEAPVDLETENPIDVEEPEVTELDETPTPEPVNEDERVIDSENLETLTPDPVEETEPTPAPVQTAESSEEPEETNEPTSDPEETNELTPEPEETNPQEAEQIPVAVTAYDGLSDDAVLAFSWYDPEMDGAAKINALQEILNGTELYHAFDLELTAGEITDAELGATITLSPYVPEKGAVLYHFTENNEYEELNYKVDEEAQAVTFVTTSFSPFAFGKAIESDPTATPDPAQKSEPSASPDASDVFAVSCTGLSADAKINVVRLQKDANAYTAYAKTLESVLGEVAIYDIIEIQLDAGEITSTSGAKVSIDNFEIVDPEHTVLYHIKGDNSIEKLHYATGFRSVSFQTGSFSAFIFAAETESSAAIEYTEFPEEGKPVENATAEPEPSRDESEEGKKGSQSDRGGNGSPNKIDNFEISFSQGAVLTNGDWVWTPGDSSEGHMFKFRITYTLWGELHYNARGIEIRVPESILVDRSNQPADTIWIPLPEVELGTGSQLVEPDGLTDENVFVYFHDEAEGEYVIYNRLPFSTAEHAYIEVGYVTSEKTYEYADYDPTGIGNNPHDQNDHAKNGSKPFSASIKLDPVNGNEITDETGNIPVYIDTNAVITSTDKDMPQYPLYTSWQSSWGTAPSNATQYVYLVWHVKTIIKGTTQPYTLSFEDIFNINVNGYSGEVCAYKLQGNSAYSLYDPQTGIVTGELKYDYPYGRYDYIITRHLKEEVHECLLNTLHEYSATNHVTATVTPVDGVDDTTSAEDSHIWTYERPAYSPPYGHFYMYKYGIDAQENWVKDYRNTRRDDLTDCILPGGQTDPLAALNTEGFSFNKRLNNLEYYTYIHGYPYPWTVSSVGSNPVGDGLTPAQADWARYAKETVTFELTDNEFYIKWLQDQSYSARLTKDDYQINFIRLSWLMRDAELDENDLDNDGLFIKEKKVEYTDRDRIFIFAQFNDEETWIPIGEYRLYDTGSNPHLIIYPEAYTFVTSRDGNAALVSFANDELQHCTGYRLVTSNKHYYTRLGAYPYVELFPSETVKAVLRRAYADGIAGTNLCEIALKNISRGRAYDDPCDTSVIDSQANPDSLNYCIDQDRVYNDWRAGIDYVSGSIRHGRISKEFDSFENDVYNRRAKYTWTIKASEIYTNRDGIDCPVLQNGGTFYDLLPIGATWSPENPVELYADGVKIPSNNYRVKYSPNYYNGRALLTVTTTEKAYRFGLTYSCYMSWDAILSIYPGNGTTSDEMLNSAAYETGNASIGEGSPDNGVGNRSDYFGMDSGDKNKNYPGFNDLDPNTNDPRFIYAECTHEVAVPVTAAIGLYKKVIGNRGVETEKDEVFLNGEYEYVYTFITDGNTRANDLILYDSLENYRNLSMWKGTLESVSVIIPNAQAVTPVIYYSTVTPDILGFAEYSNTAVQGNTPQGNFNLSATYNNVPVWSTTKPADASTITAFAIDLRGNGYVLEPNHSVYIKAKMKAPDGLPQGLPEGTAPIAYNDVFLFSTIQNVQDSDNTQSRVIQHEHTELRLRVVGDFRVKKIDANDPDRTIPGITFTLFDADGQIIVASSKTNANGIAYFDNVPMGSYLLLETAGTGDYLIDSTGMRITVDQRGKVHIGAFDDGTQTYDTSEYPNYVESVADDPITFVIQNRQRAHGDFSFVKKSYVGDGTQRSATLSGAVFLLTGKSDYRLQEEDIVTFRATSDEMGRVSFEDIDKGVYTLMEESAPAGFIRSEKRYTVTVDGSGFVTVCTEQGQPVAAEDLEFNVLAFFNEPLHSFRICKVDELSRETLSGAVFTLYKDGSAIAEAVSDASGIAEFAGLGSGAYVLKETAAPASHTTDETPYPVSIDKYGNVTIDGLEWNEEPGCFVFENARSYSVKLVVRKYWTSGTAEGRPAPVFHVSTEKPVIHAEFATIDFDGQCNLSGKSRWYLNAFMNGGQSTATSFVRDTTSVLSPVGKDVETTTDAGGNTWYKIDDNTTDASIYFRMSGTTAYWWSDAATVYLAPNSTNMFYSWKLGEGLTNYTLDLRDFNTSKVLLMNYMFYSCRSLQRVNTSGWDTSNVTKMYSMFSDCSKLVAVEGIGNWNVISVGTNETYNTSSSYGSMRSMFGACTSLQSLDLSGWGSSTRNAQNMYGMFSTCRALSNLNLSGWDTSSVQDMSYMFSSCNQLTTLDVSHFQTGNVKAMSSMFNYCTKLTSLNLSSWDTGSCINMTYMFNHCDKLTGLDLTNWDVHNLIKADQMFQYCFALTSVGDISGWDMNNVTNLLGMFYQCRVLNDVSGTGTTWDLSSWTPHPTNLTGTFQECLLAEKIILSKPLLNNGMPVTDENGNVVYTGWDTSNCTTMERLFALNTRLKEVDISSFDASKVTSFKECFGLNTSLKHVYVNAYWTNNATTLTNTFGKAGYGCQVLKGTYYTTDGTPVHFAWTNSAVPKQDGNASGSFAVVCTPERNGLLTDAKWKPLIEAEESGNAVSPSASGISAVIGKQASPAKLSASAARAAVQPMRLSAAESKAEASQPAATDPQMMESAGSGVVAGGTAETRGVSNSQITDGEGNVIDVATVYTTEDEGWYLYNSQYWFYVFDVYAEENSDTVFYIWEDPVPGYDTDTSGNYKGSFDKPIVVQMHYDPTATPQVTLTEGTVDANGVFTAATQTNVWYYSRNSIGLPGIDGKFYYAQIRNGQSSTQTASLKVTKSLAGNGITAEDRTKHFGFRVTLGDTTINDEMIGGVIFHNGVSEVFYLAGGESITFTGLPFGISYSVEEIDANTGGFTTTSTDAAGTLPEQPTNANTSVLAKVASFTNTKQVYERQYGDLILRKTVVDDETGAVMTAEATNEKEFDFTIALTGTYQTGENETANASELTGIYSAAVFSDTNGNGATDTGETSRDTYLSFTNGVASVKLKAGETVRVFDLPRNVLYAVTEAESVGYMLDQTNSTGMTGAISTGSAAAAAVINRCTLSTGGFKITKQVVGRETDEAFDFSVILNGLDGNAAYAYRINASAPVSFTSNGNGMAVVGLSLRHNDTAEFMDLPVGATYLVSEDVSGFAASFVIRNDGTAGEITLQSGENPETGMAISTSTETVDESEDITITFINMVPDYELSFAKLDENGQYLAAAVMQIRNADTDEVVEEWMTGEVGFNPRTLHLREGHYIFREKTAPSGYLTANDVEFIIEQDGSVKIRSIDAFGNPMVDGNNDPVYESALSPVTIRMYDHPTKVRIKKVDQNGSSLSGATLAIVKLDSIGREVGFHGNSWVTTTEDNGVYTSNMLEIGTRYLLRELKAPAGYRVADDIYFTIDANGDLYLTDSNGTVTDGPVANLTIEMVDPPLYNVSLAKVNDEGDYLDGASLQLIDTNGNTVISEWVTGTTENDNPHVVELDVGTYLFREVTAPAGYNYADDIYFTIDANGDLYLTDSNGTPTGDPLAELTITMVDEAGYELPQTGGSGTTAIYVLGAILILGAGITLAATVASKRRFRED